MSNRAGSGTASDMAGHVTGGRATAPIWVADTALTRVPAVTAPYAPSCRPHQHRGPSHLRLDHRSGHLPGPVLRRARRHRRGDAGRPGQFDSQQQAIDLLQRLRRPPTSRAASRWATTPRSSTSKGSANGVWFVNFLAYCLIQGLTGGSIGKLVVGLRVVTRRRTAGRHRLVVHPHAPLDRRRHHLRPAHRGRRPDALHEGPPPRGRHGARARSWCARSTWASRWPTC